jgi:lysyl-tRNA synthetase class 2
MPAESNRTLKDRAQMLRKVRIFFDSRGFTEVDCPLLSCYAPNDPHIDLFEVPLSHKNKRYLHSSPEYGMKRLLATGIGNIYQLGHVYRKGEEGRLHNPEFTLLEWYRQNISFTDFIEEACLLFREFLGPLPLCILTYREAFYAHTHLDYKEATPQQLTEMAKSRNLDLNLQDDPINIIWGCIIEPHLGKENLSLIIDYPPSQAALAKITKKNSEEVAERFEFYHQGIELGNGYHELTDANEQKKRFEKANRDRIALGKAPLPIDTNLLAALEKGLPDCYGIAIGFDRLMMLRHKASHIASILPFPWENT